MNKSRISILVGATLSATLWAYACGDGTTEPPPPTQPPDPPRPTAVTVSPATAQLAALGATVQLSAEVRDQNGQVMAGATVAWASDNAPVATVDGSGLVTTAGNGAATITATAGSASGTATVTVAQEVSAVVVSPPVDTLVARGDTVRLAAEASDANGHPVAGAELSWASSDTTVAAVDAGGLVTAAGNGAATITATVGAVSGTATVTVAQRVSAVAVTPAADTLLAGDTLRLSAVAADANRHPVAGAEFSWASSDTSVAVVDGAGLVTGVGPGQAAVTATAAGVTGRADLTVVAPAPTTIAVTPDTVALTALGQTAQLTAEVRDQAGRAMEGVTVAWSSGDKTVAAVDSVGLVTAAGNGAATITATAGEVSGTAVVKVMQVAGSVVVSPAVDTVAPGNTLRLVAEAFDKDGSVVDGAVFTWSSGNSSVATVDASGLVRGVAEGTATITASSGSAQGTAAITVANASLDRGILEAFYHATGGPNWRNSDNWITDAPLGDWHGVRTDASGRVVGLRLAYNELSGSIPAELGNLANLAWLDLNGNVLTGPIPSELGNLANLMALYIGGLDVGGNELTGPIPSELGNLANLVWLNLSLNELTGPVPAELGNLANLDALNLGGNELTGPIPSELGNLANLTWLFLGGNELTGPIPSELGNLANLEMLDLSYNELTGRIPQSFLQLGKLSGIYFGGNAGLCAPNTPAFVTWLANIDEYFGPVCTG